MHPHAVGGRTHRSVHSLNASSRLFFGVVERVPGEDPPARLPAVTVARNRFLEN